MALIIKSENFKNNNIGQDNGGLQPGDVSVLAKMRLNNGAPTRNGNNNDEISYDNEGKQNLFQDRVVSSDNGVTTTYATARDTSYFALHSTKDTSDIDNETELGNVTQEGNFHYVAPQNHVTTDKANYSWSSEGTTEDENEEPKNNRTAAINQIYMVGSVNAMSAR